MGLSLALNLLANRLFTSCCLNSCFRTKLYKPRHQLANLRVVCSGVPPLPSRKSGLGLPVAVHNTPRLNRTLLLPTLYLEEHMMCVRIMRASPEMQLHPSHTPLSVTSPPSLSVYMIYMPIMHCLHKHACRLRLHILRSSKHRRYIFLLFEERIRQKICSQQNMEA